MIPFILGALAAVGLSELSKKGKLPKMADGGGLKWFQIYDDKIGKTLNIKAFSLKEAKEIASTIEVEEFEDGDELYRVDNIYLVEFYIFDLDRYESALVYAKNKSEAEYKISAIIEMRYNNYLNYEITNIEERYAKGGMLSNKEKIVNLEFEDNTDRKLGRYDFSFETVDADGASVLDYDGYIIESAAESRMPDEFEWGQNVPEDWENAEKYILDSFYEWKRSKMAKGGEVASYRVSEFFAKLFQSRDIAHKAHLQTDSYAAHVALNEYYDGVLPLIDGMVESYQGEYGKIEIDEWSTDSREPIVEYFENLLEYIDTEKRYTFTDSSLLNQVDEIKKMIQSTLYKLKELK